MPLPAPGRIGFSLALGALLLAACSPRGRREVVVYTSVDQVFSEPVLRAFEQDAGVRVRAVFDTEETKSTGVLNRLITEAGFDARALRGRVHGEPPVGRGQPPCGVGAEGAARVRRGAGAPYAFRR